MKVITDERPNIADKNLSDLEHYMYIASWYTAHCREVASLSSAEKIQLITECGIDFDDLGKKWRPYSRLLATTYIPLSKFMRQYIEEMK